MKLFRTKQTKILSFVVLLTLLFSVSALAETPKVKNVIMMIGDGMGISHITAARIHANSPDTELHLDSIKTTGFAKTHSTSSIVTDSAAAGTALATGVRTDNGRIAIAPDNRQVKSLLLLAQERGMGTGVAVTSKLTDATPATYLVQAISRAFEEEIAEKIIDSGVNVLLGGGSELFGAHPFTKQPRTGSLINQAMDQGYLYLKDRDELLAFDVAQRQNILGLFSSGNLSYDHERFPTEPTLAEMTEIAIDQLSLYPEGFFLMVEGSKIDKASHYNMTEHALGDMIAFDEAIGVALEFASSRDDTLVVITADHETGGFGIVGGSPDGSKMNYDWLHTDHTGAMVPVYAYGPGDEVFSGTQHLTDVSSKIAELMGIPSYPVYFEEATIAQQSQIPKHVIYVIVDGFDPSYFDFGLPNLEAFAADGVWVKDAKSIMPAATTAAMTSLITGNYPKTHGVPNNVYYDPELNIRRESPRDIRVPNIGELFQEAGLTTVSVNHFMMDSGADIQITGGWNTVNSRLKEDLPDLLVFIEQTPDGVGHQRGAQSNEVRAAMKRADRSFGSLIDTIKELGIYDDSLIILTADHGMTHIEDGKRIGSALAKAVELPELKIEYLNSGVAPAEDTDLLWFHMVTGAAIIYRNPISIEQENKLIEQIKAVEGVHSIWNSEKIEQEGMHPLVADLWINLEDGYGLAVNERGGHSSVFQQSVPLIMKGPGIKSKQVFEGDHGIRIIDIVPTILEMMNLEIPQTVEGQSLLELFN